MPLVRGTTNDILVPVTIAGEGRWSLRVLDADFANDGGHMVGPVKGLAAVMQASVQGGSQVSLDQPQGGVLLDGAGATTVTVELHQLVQAVDPPGSYSIALVFEIIPGF